MLAAGLSLPAIGWHLLAGLVGLMLGFALFALGYVGGGDAKLFAVTLLWLGFRDLMPYMLIASIAGGVLTLVMLALRQCPLPQFFLRQAWIVEAARYPLRHSLWRGAGGGRLRSAAVDRNFPARRRGLTKA